MTDPNLHMALIISGQFIESLLIWWLCLLESLKALCHFRKLLAISNPSFRRVIAIDCSHGCIIYNIVYNFMDTGIIANGKWWAFMNTNTFKHRHKIYFCKQQPQEKKKKHYQSSFSTSLPYKCSWNLKGSLDFVISITFLMIHAIWIHKSVCPAA